MKGRDWGFHLSRVQTSNEVEVDRRGAEMLTLVSGTRSATCRYHTYSISIVRVVVSGVLVCCRSSLELYDVLSEQVLCVDCFHPLLHARDELYGIAVRP